MSGFDANALFRMVILLFGCAVCGLSIWAMAAPWQLRKLVRATTESTLGYYLAVGVRLLLGIALIQVAPGSGFPLVFAIIGWLSIVAAIGLLLAGRNLQRKVVAWFDRWSDSAIRAWLILGVAFGVFLVYGIF
jgi:hypothetical protein